MKKAIQIYWESKTLPDIISQNGVQAQSLGPLTLWMFVFRPLDSNNGRRPGGRFSKDPVTYRARKVILKTMIRLP